MKLFSTRPSHSIKIDIGKSFDKSISIDKLILNDIDFIFYVILTHRQSVNFIDFIGLIDRYRIDKNYPVSVEGAFDCYFFNVDFKGGNEMIC